MKGERGDSNGTDGCRCEAAIGDGTGASRARDGALETTPHRRTREFAPTRTRRRSEAPVLAAARAPRPVAATLTTCGARNLLTAFASLALVFGIALPVYAQSYASVGAVELEAVARVSPPRLTLRWFPMADATGFTVFRRRWGETSWGSALASLPGSATQYDDDGVVLGQRYEYRVVRTGSPASRPQTASAAPGNGYILAGIDVEVSDAPGAVLLVVDDTVAAALATRLDVLTEDLRADGWRVQRIDVSRTASPASVRERIRNAHLANPIRAAFLIGHVPVPYAGNVAPDGHSEHRGAWPADSFYADLDGTYTDTTVNAPGAARPENRNTPGDGKYDQNGPPSALEIEVGRIDFARMPAFSRSEVELLGDYLDRAHGFRTGAWVAMERGIVWDNLDWARYPLAASALRASSALVGLSATRRLSPFTMPSVHSGPYLPLVHRESHLFGGHFGGGSYTGSAAGSTMDLATTVETGVVFTFALGSYFGDWDSENNFLRAQIARGSGLMSVWSGLPNWWLHPLGLGETTGTCMRISVGEQSATYTPRTDGWEPSVGSGHLALLGDPTLRRGYVRPARAFRVAVSGESATFEWEGPVGGADAYVLYEVDETTRSMRRLSDERLVGTSHRTTAPTAVSGRTYAIRPTRRETVGSGTYWNLGPATFAIATGTVDPTDGGIPPVGDASVGPSDAGSSGRPDTGVPSDAGSFDGSTAEGDAGEPEPAEAAVADGAGADPAPERLVGGCACTVVVSAPPVRPCWWAAALLGCVAWLTRAAGRGGRRRSRILTGPTRSEDAAARGRAVA
jgi:hypothetical protein